MTKDEALRMALEALENNKQTHYYCEDTWYSCPQHEDGCANESVGDECTCGADKANAEIDQAITAIKEALANHIPDATKMVAQPEQELTNLERHERNVQRLFGTPQPKEPEQERNFCPRCGKRLGSNDWDVHNPQPKVEQTHNLAATVFVYQLKETGQIKCEYLDKAKDFEEDNAWEHLATLEPRMWIEYNYAKVSQPKVEQEPVAWRAPNWGHSADDYVYRDFDDPVIGADGKPSPNNEPLYTAPQPAQKPLKDEQIEKIWGIHKDDDEHFDITYERDITRAIEAAHGIKENT